MGPIPRIGFLSTTDPRDRRSWSGIHASMFDELERRFPGVVPLGPFTGGAPALLGRMVNQALWRTVRRRHDHAHSPTLARHYAPLVERRVAAAGVDIVVAPAASTLVAAARLPVPCILLSDATLAAMVDYYVPYTALTGWSRRAAMRTETRAITGAAHAVYASEWAASSAIRDHGARAEQVHVVPFGANFRTFPTAAEALAPRPSGQLRLLFIGVEWERKGGPLVLATVDRLRAMGMPVHLTIVGVEPPIARATHIEVVPFINKNDPAGERLIQQLMLDHHFLYLPSQAECYGIVFCEAASCGLPSIARRTGGIPGAIRDGVSGHLLPPEATSAEHAGRIAAWWHDRTGHQRMQRTARDLFERSHNWTQWGAAMSELITRSLR